MESDNESSAASPSSVGVKYELVVVEDAEWDEHEAAGMYQDLEVIEELVIEPDVLQQQDIVFTNNTMQTHSTPSTSESTPRRAAAKRAKKNLNFGGEAAARADLYQGHEVIEEIVIGPEILQEQDIAITNITMQRGEAAATADLYQGHEVIGDFVIIPEVQQHQDIAITMQTPTTPSKSSTCSTPSTGQSTPRRSGAKRAKKNPLNLGSESESDGDSDVDDEVAPLAIPRVFRTAMEAPEDDCPPPPHPASSSPATPPSPTIPFFATAAPTVEPNNFLDFKWRSFPNPPIPSDLRREPFSNISVGPTAPLADPYEAFVRMWNRQFMEHIASETNKYAQQSAEQKYLSHSLQPNSRICDWKDTTVDELYVFFAIILAMGVVSKGQVIDYWALDASIFMTPGFRVYMPLRRFQLLCSCLHFSDNKDMHTQNLSRYEAKLFKIQPVIDHLNSVFQSSYNLQQNIALDESLLQWKGCLDINQFIPNKVAAVGIKTYEICESQTGYLWRFVVHAHKRTETAAPDPLQAFIPNLVLTLLQGLEHKGHTVWMDNFYNSPALARKLKTLGFDCVGTLRTNRQFVPHELTILTKANMRPGQIVGLTSGDVDLVVWRDRNRVGSISTYHGAATFTAKGVTKPALIHDYNIMMGGVDKKDQMLAAFPIERKRTKVWYKKFFRRLLNVSVLNSYIICKYNNPKMSHRAFRMTLVESILKHHSLHVPTVPTTLPLRPLPSVCNAREHYVMQLDYDSKLKARKRRRCVVCKKRVTTYCVGCDKATCMSPCFVLIH